MIDLHLLSRFTACATLVPGVWGAACVMLGQEWPGGLGLGSTGSIGGGVGSRCSCTLDCVKVSSSCTYMYKHNNTISIILLTIIYNKYSNY